MNLQAKPLKMASKPLDARREVWNSLQKGATLPVTLRYLVCKKLIQFSV